MLMILGSMITGILELTIKPIKVETEMFQDNQEDNKYLNKMIFRMSQGKIWELEDQIRLLLNREEPKDLKSLNNKITMQIIGILIIIIMEM